MPETKPLLDALNRASLATYGKTIEQRSFDMRETDQISLFQDHLSGRLGADLQNEIQTLKLNNLTLEKKISELTVEISICDRKLMNQNVVFYFFNAFFIFFIFVFIYKLFVLIKNRINA
jgi:hypothetical protein